MAKRYVDEGALEAGRGQVVDERPRQFEHIRPIAFTPPQHRPPFSVFGWVCSGEGLQRTEVGGLDGEGRYQDVPLPAQQDGVGVMRLVCSIVIK